MALGGVPSGLSPLSRNSTTKLWKWNELRVEGCGLLSCPTQLVLSVFGFVVLDSLIHILFEALASRKKVWLIERENPTWETGPRTGVRLYSDCSPGAG